MPIQLRGRTIVATFAFICDGKAYYSYSGRSWVNLQIQNGFANGHSYCYGWRYRRVDCTSKRDGELTEAFRRALARTVNKTGQALDQYMANHVKNGTQILIEGHSVRLVGASTTVSPRGYEATTPAAAAPVIEAPAAKKTKKKAEKSHIEGSATAKGYIKHGVPEDMVLQFHEWFRTRTGKYSGIKLPHVVNIWKEETAAEKDEPIAQPEPVAEAEPVIEPKPRRIDMAYKNQSGIRWVCMMKARKVNPWGFRIKQDQCMEVLGIELPEDMFQAIRGWHESYRWTTRDEAMNALFTLLHELTGFEFYVSTSTPEPVRPPRRPLVEEREHKADVPFYGRRRRNQQQFHDDVALNCGDRCVITGASAIRCEAAHLIPHARQGGASFKNGLLLRSDLHKLFDSGDCAIDPLTMRVYFSGAILRLDADLSRYNEMALRPTMLPIKAENLQARWDTFMKRNYDFA